MKQKQLYVLIGIFLVLILFVITGIKILRDYPVQVTKKVSDGGAKHQQFLIKRPDSGHNFCLLLQPEEADIEYKGRVLIKEKGATEGVFSFRISSADNVLSNWVSETAVRDYVLNWYEGGTGTGPQGRTIINLGKVFSEKGKTYSVSVFFDELSSPHYKLYFFYISGDLKN